jgi:hypothetical protein
MILVGFFIGKSENHATLSGSFVTLIQLKLLNLEFLNIH